MNKQEEYNYKESDTDEKQYQINQNYYEVKEKQDRSVE